MAKTYNFTFIHHEIRKELGLSMNDYAVAELIYNLCSNPASDYPGWCYGSKKLLGEYLGLSEQSIHTILNKLLRLKLVEKHPETKHLRSTKGWYDKVITSDTKESLARLKKVEPDTKESLAQTLKNLEPSTYDSNNDSNTYKDNNVTNVTEISSPKVTISSYGNPQINEIAAYFLERLNIPKEDCTQRQSRQYWKLLLDESRTGVGGVKWLIDLAAEDQFLASNITSSKDLYYKRVKLVARKRGNAPKVAIQA